MSIEVNGFLLQEKPPVFMAKISGDWLLKHVTPSWRIKDPIEGFQRIVNEKRATEIARTVLDQERTFPNAIVLATDIKNLVEKNGKLILPKGSKFLVVDGQHRLWAQQFSKYNASYACLIHVGLSEQDMARLFVEINDNQKRVPSSLRWDLVRLVRDEEDKFGVRASDLVYELSTSRQSPLFQRIDLTGEVKELEIKQGSIAPEVVSIIKKPPLRDVGFDIQSQVFIAFLIALRDCDPDGWNSATSNFYKNRVLRALLRTIPEILQKSHVELTEIDPKVFYKYLLKIKPKTLDPEIIRGQQGSAGMAAIYKTIRNQVF